MRIPAGVGCIAPEAVSVADAVLCQIMQYLVVAGHQQIDPNVATVGGVVSSDYVVFRPDQADAVEVVVDLIVLYYAMPDLEEIYPTAESFLHRRLGIG